MPAAAHDRAQCHGRLVGGRLVHPRPHRRISALTHSADSLHECNIQSVRMAQTVCVSDRKRLEPIASDRNQPTAWFLRGGGTDAESGGSDGVGGFAQARSEHPGAGADDGAFAVRRHLRGGETAERRKRASCRGCASRIRRAPREKSSASSVISRAASGCRSSPRCASSGSHQTNMRPTRRSRGGCARWQTLRARDHRGDPGRAPAHRACQIADASHRLWRSIGTHPGNRRGAQGSARLSARLRSMTRC